MKIKKFVSIFICFAFVFPSLAKTVSAEKIESLCLTSGISGYYASVSKAAFDMVNVVFEEVFTDITKNAPQKQQPAKAEEESAKDSKAFISSGSLQKTFKTNLSAASLDYSDASINSYVSKITGGASPMSCFWMILLLAMLILSIRKQDDYAVSENICINKHPVCSI